MFDMIVRSMATDPPRGRFRAFYDWLKRGEPLPEPAAASAADHTREFMPERVGHYRVERKLGEGGMGVVYAARDERLARNIALKMMSSVGTDDTARRRFWREHGTRRGMRTARR